MKINAMIATLVAIGGALLAGVSNASTVGNVTPNILYGNGVSNGSYTLATNGVLEIGLRASLRYDSVGQAQPIYNYNSATDAYEFNPANSSASPANRSIFNFDWSIDTDTGARGASATTISSYNYVLGVDTDGGLGTNYITYDPYAGGAPDHAFGYNTTAYQAGFKATDAADFITLKNTYNVSQQSVNMGFGFLGSPRTPGLYNIYLSALDKVTGDVVATSAIRVWVGEGAAPVPLPAGLPLMATGIAGLAFLRQRRKRTA